ncbi:MAG TPA: CAP domain-containing protein [Trebonia sp.]|nr:CAP domain-containing protein [Trebonia sp.]
MEGNDLDRGTRAAATPGRRARLLLSGVAVLALLAGGSLYLARGVFSAGPASGGTGSSRTTAAGCGPAACAASQAGLAVAVPPAVVTVPPRQAMARAHPARTGPSPAASHSGSASPAQSAPAPGAASSRASAPASAASSPAPGGTSGAAGSAAAGQVLALINQVRAAAGLPALTVTAGLDASSSAHNSLMAGGCGLSHQCPGEPALGNRETAAGVGWTAAGENIGEGGPVAGTTAAIAQMAVGLTQSMLDEKPPDDGHRLNILSSTFTHIGIAVYRDGSGTVWLTQDFSN